MGARFWRSEPPQDRPKTAPRGSWRASFSLLKMVLNLDSFWVRFLLILGTKMEPKKCWSKIFWCFFGGAKTLFIFSLVLDRFQDGPRGSKRPPGGLRKPPGAPQEAPRGFQERPKRPQEASKSGQEGSKPVRRNLKVIFGSFDGQVGPSSLQKAKKQPEPPQDDMKSSQNSRREDRTQKSLRSMKHKSSATIAENKKAGGRR